MSVGRDVTEFNKANKKLKERERQYRLLTEMMPLGIVHYEIINDPYEKKIDFKVLGVNKVFEQLVEKNNSELIGKNIWDIFPKTEKYWIDFFEEIALTGKTNILENYSVSIDKYIKITAYKIESNKIAVIMEDVSEDMKKQKEIIYMSYHDSLTGLYNRRYYEDNLVKLNIPENYPLTLVMSDINGLKLINDAFGHKAGDELLVSAAKIISNCCRECDLIARIGGDEFVIVMPNTDGEEAEKIIKKINEEAKKIKVKSIELSISFGFESKTEIYKKISEVYKSAEDLMYREKLLVRPSMRSEAIETILNTLNEKDKSSEVHSRVVSNISEKIAMAFGMDRLEANEVKTAGLLHDIGKIIIPISIILKEGKLTSEEYNLIKEHPEIGFRILNSTHDMKNIADIVLNHHERWDGLGYPRGIKNNQIPLQSRIIAIADAFDAMTSKRTYREVFTHEQALGEIIKYAGTQFDPELSQIFRDNFNNIIESI
jgi:diguanylate cyclase (GGDEF)-like protein/putative nucleotidyltransferase with HDIG domain